MKPTLNIHQARTNLSRIVEAVAAEREFIVREDDLSGSEVPPHSPAGCARAMPATCSEESNLGRPLQPQLRTQFSK